MQSIADNVFTKSKCLKTISWAVYFSMVLLIVQAWFSDICQAEETMLFKPLYYNQVTGRGVIQDTKGIARGEKDALFKIVVRETERSSIFYIETYPEDLPYAGTHIDKLPVDTINMVLKNFIEYNR